VRLGRHWWRSLLSVLWHSASDLTTVRTSTVVTLLIVPTLYLIAEDFMHAMTRLWRDEGVQRIEPDVEKGSAEAPAFTSVSSASRLRSGLSGAP
jgi:hypothetical protein